MLAIIDPMFVNEKLFRIYSHFVQDKYILEGEMRPKPVTPPDPLKYTTVPPST